MNSIEDILMMVSLVFNLIGIILTVSSKIKSTRYQIDGGDFSGNPGFIEIQLGWKYKVGWVVLVFGVGLQISLILWKLYS